MGIKAEFHGSPYDYDLVVLRSRKKLPLFHNDEDRKQFLSLIHTAQRRTGICIIAYVLLESEVHFIVQAIRDSPARSRFVQRLTSQYARRFRKSLNNEPDGIHDIKHLFRRRYRRKQLAISEVTETLEELHALPEKLGLIDDKNRYLWSSRRAYLQRVKFPWLAVNWALELDKLPNFPYPLPMSNDSAKEFVTWLVEAVAHKVGLPTAELYSRKRSRQVTMVRGVVSYHAMRWGVTLKLVAFLLKPHPASTLASSTLTAAIDRYEPKHPELFDIDIQELLNEVPQWRRTNALLAQANDASSK